ncbi:MAG: GTP-binding protein [Sedimentisphaerales bacterium]|nr:GTP-binding protein [Sedimentisphaerales bacterium]
MNGRIGMAGHVSLRRIREAERRIERAIYTDAERLCLNDLGLQEIPALARKLKSLRKLVLRGNKFKEIPAYFSENRQLTHVDVSKNQLRSFPKEFGELSNLRVLDASDNALSSLPRTFASLQLKFLDLRGNNDLGIPPEILEEEDTGNPALPADILTFYYRRMHETEQRLNEAKVLLVGQGGVGKTSLVKRIVHDTFDPDENKTEGINIESWHIKATPAPKHEDEKVRLNIWDFGGQEIMHATHQFFLTKRSLYLLVLDARKGENESNIHYWLKIIQSYGGESPVIIVTNKCDAHFLELNKNRLAKDYAPNIVDFFQTSCLTGAGITELRNAIKEQIHKLPHVYDILPKSYFDVKKRLEHLAREKDFLGMDEFQSLCRERAIVAEREQNRLLRFLHDLGSVLNFDDPDDPFELRDTNILNPEWVTGGVYRILNNNMLMQAGGVLEFAELHSILGNSGSYPIGRHKFIVEMMRKFELCFDFPDTNGRLLLIPQLLSRNEPDIDWDFSDSLNFQYHYKVLPPGIICRFIVRMHSNLTEKPTYWRSGVVLEIDGNRCLVRADTDANKIYVSVGKSDSDRRRTLSVIRNTFGAIHNTIPRIRPVEKVPLPDDPSVVVDYLHLLKLEKRDVIHYLPEGTDHEYNVATLLDGIESRVVKKKHDQRNDQTENLFNQGFSLKRVIALSCVFALVLVVLLVTLTCISHYVNGIAMTTITVAGVIFTVLFIVMISLFTGVFGQHTAESVIQRVLEKIPRLRLFGGRKSKGTS